MIIIYEEKINKQEFAEQERKSAYFPNEKRRLYLLFSSESGRDVLGKRKTMIQGRGYRQMRNTEGCISTTIWMF